MLDFNALMQVAGAVGSTATGGVTEIQVPTWLYGAVSMIFLFAGFLGWKNLGTKIAQVSTDTSELFSALAVAVSDGKITPEEAETIIADTRKLIKDAADVVKK